MKLYHGSNVNIDNIDLSKSKKFKDFGTGFFLTTILDQAIERAIVISKREGGKPIINKYEFDESNLSNLKVKKFDNPDLEWARFIVNNRNRNFKDHSNELSNHDNKYDIVYGPVADDGVINTIDLFLDDLISEDNLVERLKYSKLNNQYSFHTYDAIKLLNKIESKVYYKTTKQDYIISNLINDIILLICEDYKVNIVEGMALFYSTDISKKIEDINTEYYLESASYLYEQVKEEL